MKTLFNNECTFIQANSGCGKTHRLIQIGKDAIRERKTVQFLSTVKSSVSEFKTRLPPLLKHSGQIHSDTLDGYILRIIRYFPKIQSQISPLLKKENFNSKNFAEIQDCFSENFDTLQRSINFEVLLFDEVQNLQEKPSKIFELLTKFCTESGRSVFAAGDENQTVFSERFYALKTIKAYGFQTEELTKCYRSSTSIQQFVQGYYEQQKIPSRYSIEPGSSLENEIVSITAVDNPEAGVQKIIDTLEKIQDPGQTILAVCRTNREIKSLEARIKPLKFKLKIKFLTIHKAISAEADIVFYFMTSLFPMDSNSEKRLTNVAITRAKKSLHIVTTLPSSEMKSFFKEGTYHLEDLQTVYESAEDLEFLKTRDSVLKKIPKKKPDLFLKSKSISCIDSIDVAVKETERPFTIYPEDCSDATKNTYNRIFDDCIGNFKFKFRKHKGVVYFEFRDLTHLQALGFSNEEIIHTVQSAIHCHFKGRMPIDKIRKLCLHRLEIAKIYHFEKPKMILDFLQNLFGFVKNKKIQEHFQLFYFKKKGSSKRGKREITHYFPYNKKKNKIKDATPNDLKFEVRREQDGCLEKKNLNLSLGSVEQLSSGQQITLYEGSEIHSFDELMKKWIMDEIPAYTHKSLESDSRKSIKLNKANHIRKTVGEALLSVPLELKPFIIEFFGNNPLLHTNYEELETKF